MKIKKFLVDHILKDRTGKILVKKELKKLAIEISMNFLIILF